MAGRARIFLGLGIFAAAGAGAGLALAGAAALGAFSAASTTTVREIQATGGTATATAFRTGKALSVNEIYQPRRARRRPGDGDPVVTRSARSLLRLPASPRSRPQQALGSGFVIDKAGHIVTNYHVVQGARTVDVSFSNNESMKARVVGPIRRPTSPCSRSTRTRAR